MSKSKSGKLLNIQKKFETKQADPSFACFACERKWYLQPDARQALGRDTLTNARVGLMEKSGRKSGRKSHSLSSYHDLGSGHGCVNIRVSDNIGVPREVNFILLCIRCVQESAKRWALGCVRPASWLHLATGPF